MLIHDLASWWLARVAEMIPPRLAEFATRRRGAVVIEIDKEGKPHAWGRGPQGPQEIPLGAAARHSARTPILLRVPAAAVLEKTHVMPSASAADMEAMLRHEMERITPFSSESVYWDWRARPRPGDRSKSDVTVTIVPKVSLAPALDALGAAAITPKMLEIAPNRLLSLEDGGRSGHRGGGRKLAWLNVGLACLAASVPFLWQEYDLYRTDAAIAAMKPAMAQVEAARRRIGNATADQDIVSKEIKKTGDLTAVLAALTRLLPDDTYLTDFSMRQRQIVLAGRSAAASALIPALAGDPMFRNAAFDAPVTRLIGSTSDVFSIRAEVAR